MLSQRGLHIKVCTRHTHVSHLSPHAANLSLAIDCAYSPRNCAHLLTRAAPTLRPFAAHAPQRHPAVCPRNDSGASCRFRTLLVARMTHIPSAFHPCAPDILSTPAPPLPPTPQPTSHAAACSATPTFTTGRGCCCPRSSTISGSSPVTELESSTLSQISSHLSRSSSRREPRCAFT
jgi:hypothetical protein